ncbi:unnamed protein product [Kuraishia capsulata CBS 1993]|uniref:Metallo-beta-lactamase domain-containing protein n=1 Tax=Kuraishia capsulata CBS 1993 TaxID=1382522 RepID=W6MM83_9ASCO|nr:uncharacterized protein KUCA_T00003653001 [Kuraishia capsulata CBS 1993]CDK27674.1 unnamed protein product [Kuraishia capsulata CBS 1993]
MPLSLPGKVGLGLVVSYASYTAYIAVQAQLEISKRQRRYEEHKKGLKKADQGDFDQIVDVPNRYETLNVAGRFENPFPEYRSQTILEFLLSRILELFEGKTRGGTPSSEAELRRILPVVKPDLELIWSNHGVLKTGISDIEVDSKDLPPLKDRLTFTWLGQSCSFLQLSGISFLTDPIFEDYLVNKALGPKRITPSPCKLEELPLPNFVLVSHDHPDHLESESVKKLGNKCAWIVPLGVRKYLARKGVSNVIEMAWWDRITLPVEGPDKYEVVCLPSMHWSGRYMLDANSTLWCSFMITKNGKSMFYHAGDTGYTPELFKLIREKLGPVHLSMLPIGQYCPQWHQKPRHICPSEAIEIVKDLQSKKMVGVHWGTFVLSSEPFIEPKHKLEKLAEDMNRSKDIFAPTFGKTFVMDMSKSYESSGEAREVRDGKAVLLD